MSEIEKKRVRHDLGEADYHTILFKQDKESPFVWYLTLNRPEKNNAISIGPNEMTGEIKDAMKRANHDDNVKVVVIRGAGKNYCAGFDLSFVYRVYGGEKGAKPSQRMRLQVDQDELYGFPQAILDCNKVVIVQVHGWAIEAGLYITKCADIVVAADNPDSPKGEKAGVRRTACRGIVITPRRSTSHYYREDHHGRKRRGGIVTKTVPEEDLELVHIWPRPQAFRETPLLWVK
jgi:enoyl-CoA hydratase